MPTTSSANVPTLQHSSVGDVDRLRQAPRVLLSLLGGSSRDVCGDCRDLDGPGSRLHLGKPMINLEQWERGVAGLIEVSMEFQGRLQIAAEINFRPVLEECVLDLMADARFCLRWLEVHPCPDDDLGLLADQLFSSLWLAARSVKRLVRLGHPSPVDLALVDQEIEESRSAAVDAYFRLRPFLPTLEAA